MQLNIEVTDTFSGEANYAWVRRHTLDVIDTLSDYSIMRRVKAAVGWTGKRCMVHRYGDMLEIRPQGECQVCFVSFN